ncbi:MAG: DUF72 domain-containing protein, partial [Candidatus Rokubacteria bacterium]|nr:DUF72 domain-containing protein [Candidatus Rokubacteria bacterium]
MAGRVFIGTSGYAYPHWRGLFYPERLAQREWLRFYAGCFATVELNNPFYRLPEAKTFRAWRDAVPKGFVCAVKASRYITHIKRLKDPEEPLGTFLARARLLEHALGPVLFQLPGNFHADLLRLDHFLDALARQRFVQGLRAVLEVRHPSWLERQATDRLATAGVALCLADWAECPVEGPVTADFVYVRRHGTSVRYGGSYPTRRLKEDARQIGGWLREGRDVYVYFNNDEAAFAVQDSRRLLELVGQSEGARVPTPE